MSEAQAEAYCTRVQDLRKSEEARKEALRVSQEARVARDMAAERATRLAEDLEASRAAEAAALKRLAAETAAREDAVRRLAGETTAKAAALRSAATEKVWCGTETQLMRLVNTMSYHNDELLAMPDAHQRQVAVPLICQVVQCV